MRIEISAASQPPPRGEVRIDGGDVRPFHGWLQLLSILAEALPLPDTAATGPTDTPTPLGEGGEDADPDGGP